MRFTLTQPAGEYGGHRSVFAPTAFDSQIGQRCPLKVAGVKYGDATLVEAKVSADGSSADLTFDVGDMIPALRTNPDLFHVQARVTEGAVAVDVRLIEAVPDVSHS